MTRKAKRKTLDVPEFTFVPDHYFRFRTLNGFDWKQEIGSLANLFSLRLTRTEKKNAKAPVFAAVRIRRCYVPTLEYPGDVSKVAMAGRLLVLLSSDHWNVLCYRPVMLSREIEAVWITARGNRSQQPTSMLGIYEAMIAHHKDMERSLV
jgi:hypothetical protein